MNTTPKDSVESATRVICENCGGDSVAVILSVVALVAALLSVLVAGWQLRLSRIEHQEFMRELRRRARLDGRLRVVSGAPEGPGLRRVLVEIGFENTGEKAARDVLVNLRVPDYCSGLVRADAAGNGVTTPSPATSSGPLVDASGTAWPIRYLSWVEDRVSRTHNYVRYVRFDVPAGRAGVPVQVTFGSDDLPEAGPEVSFTAFMDVPP